MILALFLFLIAMPAWAHGDAEWIMRNPDYKDATGIHCCGPVDCAVAEPGEIQRINGGWLHTPTRTVVMDYERGIYDAKDAQLWRCVRGEQLRCVFPGTGM